MATARLEFAQVSARRRGRLAVSQATFIGNRCIRVHYCFNGWEDEGKPLSCHCQQFITRRAAESRVLSGTALWRMFQKRNGEKVVNNKEIVLTGRRPTVPRATSIEKAHIQRAYVSGDREEQKRIELWGRLNQEILAGLGGVPLRERQVISPAAKLDARETRDRAVLYLVGDLRTGPTSGVAALNDVWPDRFSDCRSCGGRILRPEEWPAIEIVRDEENCVGWIRCPFCSELGIVFRLPREKEARVDD